MRAAEAFLAKMSRRPPEAFLASVAVWAESQPGLAAVVLVGSQARGEASPASDVDLVLLVEDARMYWGDLSWLQRFGTPLRVEREDWGKVQSVRVFYPGGPEVEFGIASLDWGSDPSDKVTAQVIRGAKILYTRDARLRSRLELAIG